LYWNVKVDHCIPSVTGDGIINCM